MGLLERVRDVRGGAAAVEQRGSMQNWVDLVMAAAEAGFLKTSMPTLTEEQVVGTYSNFAKGNGPIFALMMARMQVFSQARFQWTRFTGGERSDLFGSPELAILERPWRNGTTADLLARMEMDVTLAGNSYTRRVRRARTREDRLVRMRPEWVHIVMGSHENAEHPAEAADVELAGYAYLPPDEVSARPLLLEPDEVAHYAPYPDPDGVFLGMSWVTPVLRDVLGDNLQTDHKRAFLKNGATPNLVIKFDASTTIDQVRRFKALFNEEHQGSLNAYKTLFIGGGADVTPIGKDFREIDFSATQGKAESRLASAAGVPPSWVGFSEGLQGSALNAGNFTAARRRFGDGTMQHLWANAATSLEAIVAPPDPGASLWFVTRGIPFLHMDASDEAGVQAQEAQTITALVRDGFTAASVIDAVTNRDWSRLVHTGLTSVQLQPPTDGTEPFPADTTPNPNGNQASVS
jgi:phage portal protein BeeE